MGLLFQFALFYQRYLHDVSPTIAKLMNGLFLSFLSSSGTSCPLRASARRSGAVKIIIYLTDTNSIPIHCLLICQIEHKLLLLVRASVGGWVENEESILN
jgi:hypothetical protein